MVRAIVLLCALALQLLAQPLWAAQSLSHQMFQVDSQILPNQLLVIRRHRDVSDTFTVQLVVEVGLQDFDCSEQQLPHLLEHMLFEGTEHFDRQALRQRIRDHGGKPNGFTTEEYTYYTIDIHADYPEIALENLYRMMSESLFLPDHLTTSRQVIHAELGTSSNPLQQSISRKQDLHKTALSRIWAGSRLECPDLTTPDGISMQRLKSVFNQFYVASNMTLIIIGHFDDARIDRALQNTLARLPLQTKPDREAVTFDETDADPVIIYKGLFDPESDVTLYARIPGTVDPDYPAFEIAAEYLGEKLFYNVRGKKGLGYTPNAFVSSNSAFGFLRAATKTSDRWHEEVVTLFQQQYASMLEDGIPDADVMRLKRKLVLDFESRQRDNSELAQYYRHFRQVIRQQGAMPDLIERLQQMQPAQVNRALRGNLPGSPLMASSMSPTTQQLLVRVVPGSMALAGVGIILLRWSHRRRQRKLPQ